MIMARARFRPDQRTTRDRDSLAALRARLSDHGEILKTNSDRIAAELAKAIAENRARSNRWT